MKTSCGCVVNKWLIFGKRLRDIDQVKEVSFDIISSDLTQDARAAVRGMRILRSQDFFTAIDKPDYIVWADCGKHFRNCEFIGYLSVVSGAIGKHVNYFKISFFSKSKIKLAQTQNSILEEPIPRHPQVHFAIFYAKKARITSAMLRIENSEDASFVGPNEQVKNYPTAHSFLATS